MSDGDWLGPLYFTDPDFERKLRDVCGEVTESALVDLRVQLADDRDLSDADVEYIMTRATPMVRANTQREIEKVLRRHRH